MSEIRVRRELGGGASLEWLRGLVGEPRPASVARLLERYAEPVVLSEPLVTADGVALGGHHQVALRHDGTWRYEGHFRATGWPSYRVSLSTQVVGADGAILALAASGEVHGTSESGSEEHAFVQEGHSPQLQLDWARFRGATLRHDLQYDADFFGTAGEVVAILGKAAAAAAGGAAGAMIVLGSEAIAALDLPELAVPGTVGVLVAGGVLLAGGPAGLVPAVVAGAVAGTAAALSVRQRPLRDDERAFADRVFRGTVPFERVLLTDLLGLGDRPFACPGPGGVILVNVGDGFDAPTTYRGAGRAELDEHGKPYKAAGQLLVHELTHAWQIAHSEFIPGLMCRGILNQLGTLGGDMRVYLYGTPNLNWDELNLEQQCSVVDEWFAATGTQQGYPPMHDKDESTPGFNPYYRFVRDHIRARVA